MADSAAERQRRRRAHGKGDHSLCHTDRCRDARLEDRQPSPDPAVTPDPPAPQPEDVEAAPPGGIEVAVAAYVVSLKYPAGDPRAILGEIAVRLAKRVDDSGALPAAVRELRVLLAQIGEVPNGPAGVVDEVRLQRTQRRLNSLLSQAS
ncbi:hypothetical protein AB0M54_24370 [Actinoplanes sp. NPDC051470]|uniref:hypothetical protein n=1 Tax=Actinoplanes sp. NPDC051470 TaxID=3157224 RepID=UPI00343A01AF